MLGLQAGDLLDTSGSSSVPLADHDAVVTVGALVMASYRADVTALARETGRTLDDVLALLGELDTRLATAGLRLARHADAVWLEPATSSGPCTGDGPLDRSRAVLLRRIHRGEDVRRRLSRPQRQFIRPWLHNTGLINWDGPKDAVSAEVAFSLSLPTPDESEPLH